MLLKHTCLLGCLTFTIGFVASLSLLLAETVVVVPGGRHRGSRLSTDSERARDALLVGIQVSHAFRERAQRRPSSTSSHPDSYQTSTDTTLDILQAA